MKNAVKSFFSLPKDDNRVFGLDIFRSLAILIVVYQHSRIFLADYFPNMPTLSFIDGVDVFFVLSGFLIGSILLRTFDDDSFGIRSVLVFWKRRWFRTLPNYFLVLILIIVINLITQKPNSDFNYKYLLFLQNFTADNSLFFPESWSLSVEEWFYLLFPIALFVIWKISHFNKRYIFISVALLFIIMTLLFRFYAIKVHVNITSEVWEKFFRKSVVMRLDMLMFGMIAAFTKKYYRDIWKKTRILFLFIGALLILFTAGYIYATEYHIFLYFTFIGISFMFLLPFADSLKFAVKWIRQPIYFISSISYSMYLLNYTVLMNIFQNNFINKTETDGIVLYISYWALLLVLSFILFKFFERPVMKLRDRI